MNFAALLEGAVKVRASDIHLSEEHPPYFRLDGDILPVGQHPPLTHEDMRSLCDELLNDRLKLILEQRRGVDLGYQYKEMTRCRFIIYYERQKLRAVIRLIPMDSPTLAELNLPPAVTTVAGFQRGLILVTGPTGSGKSTTLAAMIDHINSLEKIAIVTIEDPIEFVHKNKKAVVSQREVGEDVMDFNAGLVQALRQDPDVILVGEMRDVDTMRIAIKAAETGHLVLSTLHTTSAVQTIERIIGTFPQAEHALLRDQLATNLKACIAQNLVKKAEGKGRAAAHEILVVSGTVSKLIRDNRMTDIPGVMQGRDEGMQTFDQGLADLVREKKITEAEGEAWARDIHALRRYIKGVTSSGERGGIIAGFGG